MNTEDAPPEAAATGEAVVSQVHIGGEAGEGGAAIGGGGLPEGGPPRGASPSLEKGAGVDGGDDEEPTCRVCHMEAEPDRPLYHPCWCRGSIKHVHQDCLLQWLAASKNTARRCELCSGSFTFAPVYAQGAPKVLTLWELAGGLYSKICFLWPIVLQGGLLAMLWLVILPIITSAVFQMYFCASFSELRTLLSLVTMCKPRDLVVECLGGTVLCTSIVVISLVAISIRDTLLAQWRGMMMPPQDQQRRGRRRQNVEGGQGAAGNGGASDDDGDDEDDDDEDEDEGEEEQDDAAGRGVGGFGWGGGGPAMMGDGGGEQQGEDDVFEQIVDVRELIGLNAPLPVSARRWAQLVFYNLAFLTTFQLLPYTLGRVIWALLRHQASLSHTTAPLPDTPTDVLLQYTRALTEKLILEGGAAGGSVHPGTVAQQVPLMALDESGLAILLDKLLVLGLGYGFLFALFLVIATVRVVMVTLQDPRQTLRHLKSIQRGLSWLLSWIKVGVFTSCDLVMIPLILGWVMDMATVECFGTTATDRVTFFLDWPFVSLSAHWLCGFSFMALAALLATELRRTLHPDVMRGILPQPGGADGLLHEPAAGVVVGGEGGDNLADILASRSLMEHCRKVLISLLLYLPLLLVMLYFPVRFGHVLLHPSLGPLRLHFMPTSALYLEMQLPLELFLFHVAMPLMLERFRLRDIVRWCLEHAFAQLCRLLGLGPSLLDSETLHPTSPPHALTPPPSLYHLRLALLILLSLTSLFLASTFIIHVPIRIGRYMLAHVGLPTDHDFYNVFIGLLSTWVVLWATKVAIRSIRAHLPLVTTATTDGAGRRNGGPRAWAKRVGHVMSVACKTAVLAILWLIALPVLVGLLFELVVIIPARVPLNETPFFSAYEAWALGLVFLKIWVRCSLLGVLGADYTWKHRFERVRNNGLRRLDFCWTLQQVIWPVFWGVSGLILTPYCIITTFELLLSRDLAADPPIIPTGASFEEVDHALLTLKRHGYMMFLMAKAAALGFDFLRDSFRKLHDRIRDDQYLVGLELKNRILEPEQPSSASSSPPPPSSPSSSSSSSSSTAATAAPAAPVAAAAAAASSSLPPSSSSSSSPP